MTPQTVNLLRKILLFAAPAVVGIALALIVASPKDTPALLTPSVTQPIMSPVVDPRLAYVQQQLVTSGFEEAEVNKVLTDIRLQIYPLQTVAHKTPNWTLIRRKLYSSNYVQQGKNYIRTNQAAFDKAEQDFGVPKGIITGIIAVETEFGKNTGSTPTFNAIYSRLNYKKPEENWRLEAERLIALSKYCLQFNLDCYAIKGSYAGAMGIVQFMPDSLMNYGIDGDGNGIIELLNPADAIPSAANFLKKHGWDDDQKRALTSYYGSSVGYPDIVLTYASLLAK